MQTLDSLQLQRSTILFTFHTPRGTLSQERTPRLRKSFSLLGIGSSGPELHQNTSHPRDGLRATLTRQGLQSTTADSSSGNHFTRGNNELPGKACWIRSRYHDTAVYVCGLRYFHFLDTAVKPFEADRIVFLMFTWSLFLRCSIETMIQRTRTTQCKHYNCDASFCQTGPGRVANTRETPNSTRIFTGNVSRVRCTS